MKDSMGMDRNAFVRDARKPWHASVADCGGIAVPFAAFSFVHRIIFLLLRQICLCLPSGFHKFWPSSFRKFWHA